MVHHPTISTLTSGVRSRHHLEIIPDTRFIVFEGSEHEASAVRLTGRVRLTTTESMVIMKPKIWLEGKRKVRWYYLGTTAHSVIEDKRVFWKKDQKLGVETAHKISAGTMEWGFEFDLEPSMPESVEGLRETYIAYHLHASVSRSGWNAKDLVAHQHIRIVRTLGQESMESTRSRVNEDIWANKISYSISIPTDAVVFGSSIVADVELSPLKKGIRLGKVELRLMETVVRRIQAADVPDIRVDRSKQDEFEVAKMEMDFPENSRITYDDETVDNPTIADEMYKFKATLPLPKSLNDCRQDVDQHHITVSHRFKLMVNIHNPEGHTSQLVCRLPVKLFISPNLPVDDSNQVQAISHVSDVELNNPTSVAAAPPEYGRHQLDQMYHDMDPSGFLSRAGSGPGTPAGLMAQSRRGSHENVLSLNSIADVDRALQHHGSAVPQLLHSRLTSLQDADGTTNHPRPYLDHSPSGGNSPAPGELSSRHRGSSGRSIAGYFATANGSGGNSADVSGGRSPHTDRSRRTSDEMPVDVNAAEYNMDSLSRVPSYNAAVRTPGAVTPFTEGPPSYIDATSRPPSPQLSARSPHPLSSSYSSSHLSSLASSPSRVESYASLHPAAIAIPSRATGAGTPPQLETSSATQSASSPTATSPTTTQAQALPIRPHHVTDEAARLRMLRAGV